MHDCVCERGRFFSLDNGIATCQLCPFGSSTNAIGSTSVSDCICEKGRFLQIDAGGAATCPLCKDVIASSQTHLAGATSIDACVCDAGFFMKSNGTSASKQCIECDPAVMDCLTAGSELSELKLLPGFWRGRNTTNELITRCFNPAACIGAQTANATSVRRRLALGAPGATVVVVPSSTFGDGLCAAGHTGPFCFVCADGYIGGNEKELCAECGGNMAYTIFVGVVVVILLVAAIVLFIRAGSQLGDAVDLAKAAAKAGKKGAGQAVGRALAQKAEVAQVASASEEGLSKREKTRRRAKKAAAKTLGWTLFLQDLWKQYKVKVKIMVSLYQVLQGLGGSFSIPYPKFYGSVTGGVGNAVQIELPSLVPVGCVVPVNFYATFIFSTTWPLVVYAIFFVGGKTLYKLGRTAQADILIDGNFFLMFRMQPRIEPRTTRQQVVCEVLERSGVRAHTVQYSTQASREQCSQSSTVWRRMTATRICVPTRRCSAPIPKATIRSSRPCASFLWP